MCLTTEIESVHQPLHLIGNSLLENVHEMKEIPHRRRARTCEKGSATLDIMIENEYTFHNVSIPKRDSLARKCHITNLELNKHITNICAGGKQGLNDDTSSITSVMDFEDNVVTRSVTWAQPSVVTEIRYRPRVTVVEKQALFYDGNDMQRFRADAKIASQLARTRKLKSSQTSSHYNSPVSGIVDMATSYLEQLLTYQVNSSNSRDGSNSNMTENTNTLIDTLYLF